MLKSVQITNKGTMVLAGVVLSIVALVIAKEWWELLLLPVGMLVVWLTLYRLDWAMWFVVAATPLYLGRTSEKSAVFHYGSASKCITDLKD